MFISFRLCDAETHYSNSEREALAVIRCLAEICWMVISSPYAIFVYTDHEALRVLLTGLDNDAYGRIAKWQERLGKYNYKLFHRSVAVHFMGIADGLSRLPTHLIQNHFAEDSEGIRPQPAITTSGQAGIDLEVPANAHLAVVYRRCRKGVVANKDARIMEVGGAGGAGVAVLLVTGNEQEGESKRVLEVQAKEIRRGKWQKWLDSGFYGGIVRIKLDGIGARDELDLGRNEWRALENRARRYIVAGGK